MISRDDSSKPRLRKAFTLVELLVVITIIGILAAIAMPALNAARESSRRSACANNLRQLGMGLTQHADRTGVYCSGAFDWMRDGAVTETGWVADLANAGMPVGQMLCPSNPNRVASAYAALLGASSFPPDGCVDWKGSPPRQALDGTTKSNPCRAIIELGLAPGSESRRLLVEKEIYEPGYNTNYTASWWLVRGGVATDASGNLRAMPAACPATLRSRNAALGPLSQALLDTGTAKASTVPLLACGGPAGGDAMLMQPMGPNGGGAMTVESFTAGPRICDAALGQPLFAAPSFASGTPREGATGWWAGWSHHTLQDYRDFIPVHRGTCNILFCDGSVQTFTDTTRDKLLNNGFPGGEGGFNKDTIEIAPDRVYSRWSLKEN